MQLLNPNYMDSKIFSINWAIKAIRSANARPGKYKIIFFINLQYFSNKKSVKKR